MQRYFIKNSQKNNNIIFIEGSDYHHIKNVMRMRINDKVYVCLENEETFICIITSIEKDKIILNALEEIHNKSELEINITIAHGVVRKDKQEEVMRRITELGAYCYIPIVMKRSNVKINDDKNERFKLIVKEASEQSHRTRIMNIKSSISLDDLIKEKANYDLCLFAYEDEGRKNNYSISKIFNEFKGKNILCLFGPEGGFSPEEVELLTKNNFLAIGLGPRILRTETAPLYFMSLCSYEFEIRRNYEN